MQNSHRIYHSTYFKIVSLFQELRIYDCDQVCYPRQRNIQMNQNSTAITSAAVVLSSIHGRERRKQRKISKADLLAAVKYGKKEKALYSKPGEQRWMYTFADIVYLTDSTSTREITSWPVQCCGIDVEKKVVTPQMQNEHYHSLATIRNKSAWRSHTVAVVDQSGSMRKADASEDATRSDVVWLALALELVGKKLENGEYSSKDVFSIISMRGEGEVLVKEQPVDWLLYNRIIDLLRTQHPIGDGNYIPSLDKAEKLLSSNPYSGCALQLIFLSDGRPSDRVPSGIMEGYSTMIEKLEVLVRERISKLASRFGRRLSVGAIAFGQPNEEDFATLKALAEAAKEFNSKGVFSEASLSINTLSETFTTLSSTLTTTKSEMSDIRGTRQRKVKEVFRESINTLGSNKMDNSWLYFPYTCESGMSSIVKSVWSKDKTGWRAAPRKYIFSSPDAKGLALKKRFFGEGAERLVREFREVGADNYFVGEAMVAKESRFVDDAQGNTDKKEFHKVFCKTQRLAQKLAGVFNKRLQNLPGVDRDTVPIIKFLNCFVYMVNDPKRGARFGLLGEKMLDIKRFKYKKWNNNDGQVFDAEMNNENIQDIKHNHLEDIVEEEEEDENWDNLSNYDCSHESHHVQDADITFRNADIPQVFSCFTYRYTKRRLLVCDLQGVFNTSVSPPEFQMTDPVIHYKSQKSRRHVYGRTDLGEEGIHNFFRTHKHTKLCSLIHRRWLKQKEESGVHPGARSEDDL